MITENDIRIGNIFKDIVIESISKDGFNEYTDRLEGLTKWGQFEYLEPILLAPEILEKCGFGKNEDLLGEFEEMYESEHGHHIDKENGVYKWWLNDRYYTYVELKYLHQLQNLFYVLVGEELAVKL